MNAKYSEAMQTTAKMLQGERTALLTMTQMALPEKAAVEQSDYKPLETIVSNIVKEKQPFQRLSLSKDDL